MKMKLSKCEKLYTSIINGKQISQKNWTEFPGRLAIAFYTFDYRWSLAAKAKEKPMKTWELCRRRKAHKNYTRVLQEIPHFFLIFLLAVSPRMCNASLTETFINEFRNMAPIDLDTTFRKKIESAAALKRLEELPDYRKWFALVFPS